MPSQQEQMPGINPVQENPSPRLAAAEESRQRIAEAQSIPPTPVVINGKERLMPGHNIDVEAERYALAANTILPESGTPITAQEIRSTLTNNPGSKEMLDRYLDRFNELEQKDSHPMMSHDEMAEVMSARTKPEEAQEKLDEINQESRELLPENSMEVGSAAFARTRFNASVYKLKLLDESLKKDRTEEGDAEVDAVLAESKLWERVANGETIPFNDSLTLVKSSQLLRDQKPDEPKPANEAESSNEDIADQIPDNWDERDKYAEVEFDSYDSTKVELYKAYILKELKAWGGKLTDPNTRYPDSVAGILGNGESAPKRFLAQLMKRNGVDLKTYNEMGGYKFSQVCKDHLGFDVHEAMPEYNEKFR